MKKVSDRLYFLPHSHIADQPCLGYVRGDRRALQFDAGSSPRHVGDFRAELGVRGLPEPDFAVISHWHWDHAFGIRSLNCPAIACRLTNERLAAMREWGWDDAAVRGRLERREDILFAVDNMRQEYGSLLDVKVETADVVFDERLEVDLGGIACELVRVGGPHSEDSVVCLVREEKFLFVSDSAGKDLMGEPWEYDPERPELLEKEWEKMGYDRVRLGSYLEKIRVLDFEKCLLGHAGIQPREAFIRYLERELEKSPASPR